MHLVGLQDAVLAAGWDVGGEHDSVLGRRLLILGRRLLRRLLRRRCLVRCLLRCLGLL